MNCATYDSISGLALSEAPQDWQASDPENKPQPVVNVAHCLGRKGPDSLSQLVAIQSDKLRHVHDRGFGQTRVRLSYTDVARSVSQGQIGSDDSDNHCRNPALIERVGLHDHNRTSTTRAGSSWSG